MRERVWDLSEEYTRTHVGLVRLLPLHLQPPLLPHVRSDSSLLHEHLCLSRPLLVVLFPNLDKRVASYEMSSGGFLLLALPRTRRAVCRAPRERRRVFPMQNPLFHSQRTKFRDSRTSKGQSPSRASQLRVPMHVQ